jgi:hypothetical protein
MINLVNMIILMLSSPSGTNAIRQLDHFVGSSDTNPPLALILLSSWSWFENYRLLQIGGYRRRLQPAISSQFDGGPPCDGSVSRTEEAGGMEIIGSCLPFSNHLLNAKFFTVHAHYRWFRWPFLSKQAHYSGHLPVQTSGNDRLLSPGKDQPISSGKPPNRPNWSGR